jgi:tetratricopeptide (TPR) repeat protein/DNA-binding XRE family transcriptional regulator
LGLSQEALATKAGVAVKTISSIENGHRVPRLSTVRQLADALQLQGEARDRFLAFASTDSPGDVSDKPSSGSTPAQLPLDVRGFTGRVAQLDVLDTIASAAQGQSAAVVVTALSGTAGVGKTALAVHWAHRGRHRFPDGQLYVNLRGFDPAGPVAPAEAVRRFLDALDVEPQRVPVDLDAQAALYRSRLAGKRMLVVLDNARDPDQVRPLLPGVSGCMALITSRNQLAGLVAAEGAYQLPLDLLTVDEARDLLARRIGADRVAAEPGAVDEIIERCARLPLALAVVAARATVHPQPALATLATQLRDAHDRLDALTTGDAPATDIRAVFSWSLRSLSPDAARLFRLLGLHPGPDISTPAAASLAALAPARVRPLLAELARAHLIVEHTPGRYSFHDLLGAYAAEQAHTAEPDDERHAAIHRLLDHYLHSAYAAAMLVYPHQDPVVLTPSQPGVVAETVADDQQAVNWFTTERAVLLAAVDRAASAGFDRHAWQLAWTLGTYLDRRGLWHDWVTIQRTALSAARRLGDGSAQARMHRDLANAYTSLGRLDDAHAELLQALDLYGAAGDQVGQGHTLNNLAWVRERQGRYAEGLDHARQAYDLAVATGLRRGQARALTNIGWFHAQLGDHEEALTACQQALAVFQELGNRAGEAATWDSLGYIHRQLGHHAQAVRCYRHALDLYRNLGDRYNEATTLTNLGDTQHAAGDVDATHQSWQQALHILDDLDHPDAGTVRTKLRQLNDLTGVP